MAVRIGDSITELGRHTLLKAFRYEVLPALGFLVQLFDWILHYFEEKALDKPMVPGDLQGTTTAGRRKTDALAIL